MRARIMATVIVVTSLLLTTVAFAVGPIRERTHFENETFAAGGVRNTCAALGYPLPHVVNVLNGDILAKTYVDSAGNVTRQTEVAPGFTHTWLNPDNGKSVTSNQPYHFVQRFNADASSDITLSGLVYRIKVPGEGVVAMNSGRIEFHVAADGTQTVTESSGPEDPLFPALCQVLSD